MTVLNFPDTTNQPPDGSFQYVENGVTYTWDGVKWTANSDTAFVNINGDTMTGNLTVPSLNGGPLAGLRNQLINGSLFIWQRGVVFGASASTIYTADRWSTGGATSGVQVSPYNEELNSNGLSFTTAATDGGMYQPIELLVPGATSQFVSGSIWTLSWYEPTANLDIVPVAFWADNSNGNNAVFHTVSATSSGEVVGLFTRRSCQVTITGAIKPTNVALVIGLTLPANTNTAFYKVQFEPGPVPTPFEYRPISLEMSMCQRYFQTMVFQMSSGNAAVVPYYRFTRDFVVPMRTTPNIDFSSPNSAVDTTAGVTQLSVESWSPSAVGIAGMVLEPLNQTVFSACSANLKIDAEI